MKKNLMGLGKHEYAAYLREQESIALQGAHDASGPSASGLYDQADECRDAARCAEASRFSVDAIRHQLAFASFRQ